MQIITSVFTYNQDPILCISDSEGTPFFKGFDIAKALGYQSPDKAVRNHCKKVVRYCQIVQPPRNGGVVESGARLHPETAFIPESDVYRLTLKSQLPSAVAFQDWIVEVLIPSVKRGNPVVDWKSDNALQLKINALILSHEALGAKREMEKTLGTGDYATWSSFRTNNEHIPIMRGSAGNGILSRLSKLAKAAGKVAGTYGVENGTSQFQGQVYEVDYLMEVVPRLVFESTEKQYTFYRPYKNLTRVFPNAMEADRALSHIPS